LRLITNISILKRRNSRPGRMKGSRYIYRSSSSFSNSILYQLIWIAHSHLLVFDTPERRALVLFIEADPAHRRLSLGELSHAMGYTCSETTVRRALAMENLFRYIAKSQPFITEMNRVCRTSYVDQGLALPTFHQCSQ
jgi:Transposase